MEYRRLGHAGPSVSALGLGCMGMSVSYGERDEMSSRDTVARALDLGVNFFDTANVYGDGHNERLIGPWLAPLRERLVIATKVGLADMGAPGGPRVCGRPDSIRAECDASLARLGIDCIDLYYLHRVDPAVPVEDSIGAMAGLVAAGKVRWLGLSEVSATTLRRACKVHPITAVQSEYSLWTRDPEDAVLPACRELGVGFVPFSPLGRAMLTGRIEQRDFVAGDSRQRLPRFSGENFTQNLALVQRVADFAAGLDCTPGQLALAWLLAQGEDIVPIPGTKRVPYLEENLGALSVVLTPADCRALAALVPREAVAGERYGAATMALVDRD